MTRPPGTPLDHQAALVTKTGYAWGFVTLHLPNPTADRAWAGARQGFTGQPNLGGEALPAAAGVSATVHGTTVGLDAEVTAGGGC